MKFLCALFALGSLLASDLTLEEKVGQLLMAHFNGEIANEEAKVLVNEAKVGGIIYYNWSNGLYSKSQVTLLSESLQELTKKNTHPFPLFIAVDQEGGVVNRLSKGFTHFPSHKALGVAGEPHLAYLAALQVGQELMEAGVNMNFAPVVDVNNNPRNPVIGIRSFGEDPLLVTKFGKAALEGYKHSRILSTLKHFPGHGDVEVDSHVDLPVLSKSLEDLERMELLPFIDLAPFADLIMTAHILVPALDEKRCATISDKVIGYLRERGFDKVVITDSLVMDGLLKQCASIEEAAILAINAGCDIVLLGGRCLTGQNAGLELSPHDVFRIHKAIVDAVREGRIPGSRIEEALRRVLALKEQRIPENKVDSAVWGLDPKSLCEEIAKKAIRVVGNRSLHLGKNVALIAPRILEPQLELTSLSKMPAFFFEGLDPSKADMEFAVEKVKEADGVIVCSYNAWRNRGQGALIHALLESGKPIILLVTRDPTDAALFKKVPVMIQTFSPTAASIEAAIELFLRKTQGSSSKITDH